MSFKNEEGVSQQPESGWSSRHHEMRREYWHKELGDDLNKLGCGIISDEHFKTKYAALLADKELREGLDPLTGFFTKPVFWMHLKESLAANQRYNEPFSMLILDLDDFKAVNDTFGHLAGDKVLRQLGHVVKGVIRVADTPYRYGGEEFIIILPNTDENEAVEVGERIRKEVEEFKEWEITRKITVSIGVGQYQKGLSDEEFFQSVDKVIYRAKKSGKNRVERESKT